MLILLSLQQTVMFVVFIALRFCITGKIQHPPFEIPLLFMLLAHYFIQNNTARENLKLLLIKPH